MRTEAHPLSVTEASDGRVLLHCFAGCDTIDVLQAIGLDWKDLFPGGMDTNAKREYRKQASAQAKKDAEFILLFAENAPFLSESDEQYFAGIRKNLDDAERVLAEAERTEAVVSPRLQADIHTPLPFSTDKGKPLKHIANLAEICAHLGRDLPVQRHQEGRGNSDPLGEGFQYRQSRQTHRLRGSCRNALFDFATDKLGDFLTYLSDKNLYNPVAEWIDSRPWDGVRAAIPVRYRHIERLPVAQGNPDEALDGVGMCCGVQPHRRLRAWRADVPRGSVSRQNQVVQATHPGRARATQGRDAAAARR